MTYLERLAVQLREERISDPRSWKRAERHEYRLPRHCISDGCEGTPTKSSPLCSDCVRAKRLAHWCPSCGRQLMRHDQQASGSQRYRCHVCRMQWVEYAAPWTVSL